MVIHRVSKQIKFCKLITIYIHLLMNNDIMKNIIFPFFFLSILWEYYLNFPSRISNWFVPQNYWISYDLIAILFLL